jgi:hypothetical protein
MNRHIDYIHYNLMLHSFVRNPRDWQHSSILEPRYSDVYPLDWGCDGKSRFDGEFGE